MATSGSRAASGQWRGSSSRDHGHLRPYLTVSAPQTLCPQTLRDELCRSLQTVRAHAVPRLLPFSPARMIWCWSFLLPANLSFIFELSSLLCRWASFLLCRKQLVADLIEVQTHTADQFKTKKSVSDQFVCDNDGEMARTRTTPSPPHQIHNGNFF